MVRTRRNDGPKPQKITVRRREPTDAFLIISGPKFSPSQKNDATRAGFPKKKVATVGLYHRTSVKWYRTVPYRTVLTTAVLTRPTYYSLRSEIKSTQSKPVKSTILEYTLTVMMIQCQENVAYLPAK